MTTETQAEKFELSHAALLESVLFVASGPVSTSRLAKTLEISTGAVETLLHDLAEAYAERGLRLQWTGSAVQLGLEVTARISQAALEVLAMVAYMQPITRPQIDQIRGVNSDGALRTLLSKGLLEENGRLDTPGRPILYGTTPQFLQQFGLGALAELPSLAEEKEGETE